MANAAQVKISTELADKIRAHGAQTYPHECCGALLGRDTEVADRRVYREIHA
jgi:proteasome lid subunit RPN8/RPN11